MHFWLAVRLYHNTAKPRMDTTFHLFSVLHYACVFFSVCMSFGCYLTMSVVWLWAEEPCRDMACLNSALVSVHISKFVPCKQTSSSKVAYDFHGDAEIEMSRQFRGL